MKFINKLSFRIWFAINTIVLTGVLTLSGLYLHRESSQLENSLKNEGITSANTLNAAIGLYMLRGEYSKISPLTYSLQSRPNIAYVIVRDKEGTTINQKGETSIDKQHLMITKVPLEYFQEHVGEVEIGLKTKALEEQQDRLLRDTFFTAVVYSLLSLIISFLISSKLTAPIQKLIVATKKLTAGERNVEVWAKHEIVEIQELSTEFNKMAQTINDHEKILVNEIEKATRNLSEKVEILEVLASISNSVLEDDIQSIEVMKRTLISIKNYIKADQISFTLINNNERLEVFGLEQNENLSSLELKMGDKTINAAIHKREIIVRNRLHANNMSYYEQLLYYDGLRSLLILPIIAKNKVLGTLNIASQQQDYFSPDVIEKLSVFTNQIALAFDRVAAYESLQKSAYYDYLTGLPNFRLYKNSIQEALEQANKQNKMVGVMFLDLDRFKMVNDTFGHAAGDFLLQHIGKLLISCLSEKDVVSRIGGDEFSVLLANISGQEEAIDIAKKIMKALAAPVIIQGCKLHISASIGISFFPQDGTDVESLIRHADRAMYRIKKQGKNNYGIYSTYEDDNMANPIVLENDLRKALERNEFVVYYQPKIDVEREMISGVEALVRWEHPKKGLITPIHFIPLAEETGLILQIGEYVLRQACQQCVQWQCLGLPPIPVSVNLSIGQFMQSNLISNIQRIMNETGIQPELLEFEITESMSMNLERSIEILSELKKLGVHISVDDFGTGYSSLNYLRQLPIDTVKIDKSFMKGIPNDRNNEAIVATIINMAHNLNLTVTAEGVETFDQVQYLRKHNCDNIQGFYFRRPLPAEVFEQEFQHILNDIQKVTKIPI
jgi:diguanylate cyclase (GGDEF)-like protein